MPVASGFAPAREAFDADLAVRLHGDGDVTCRQLTLPSWFFEKYHALLPREHVIHYEAIVFSGGKALRPISAAARFDGPLASKNDSRLYDHGTKQVLAE